MPEATIPVSASSTHETGEAGTVAPDPHGKDRHSLLALAAANPSGTLRPVIPVFLVQMSADAIVRPAATEDTMRRLCASGSAVQRLMLPNVGHGLAAMQVPSPPWTG
jgi:hypothetical protein